MFASLAGAWIIPGLVGPVLAGWITEQLSWRWVFGGLAPFAALGGVLTRPLRQLRSDSRDRPDDRRRMGFALLAAAGVAGVAKLGEQLSPPGLAGRRHRRGRHGVRTAPVAAGGHLTFGTGVPAAIAFRGALAGSLVGMEVIVPLTLSCNGTTRRRWRASR